MRCECCTQGYPCKDYNVEKKIKASHGIDPESPPMGCKNCHFRCRQDGIVASGRIYCIQHSVDFFINQLELAEEHDTIMRMLRDLSNG
ncbi:MAG: hypothetical protein QXT63_05525 [Thermoplasmata archaeon]